MNALIIAAMVTGFVGFVVLYACAIIAQAEEFARQQRRESWEPIIFTQACLKRECMFCGRCYGYKASVQSGVTHGVCPEGCEQARKVWGPYLVTTKNLSA